MCARPPPRGCGRRGGCAARTKKFRSSRSGRTRAWKPRPASWPPVRFPSPSLCVPPRPPIRPRLPHFAPEIIAHHQPDHPVSGQYRELLAAMTPARRSGRDGPAAGPGPGGSGRRRRAAQPRRHRRPPGRPSRRRGRRRPTPAGRGGTSGPAGAARPVRRAGRRRHAGTGLAADRTGQPHGAHGRRTGAGGAATRRRDAGLGAASASTAAAIWCWYSGRRGTGGPKRRRRPRPVTWCIWCFPNRKPARRAWTNCCKPSRATAPASAAAFSRPERRFTAKTKEHKEAQTGLKTVARTCFRLLCALCVVVVNSLPYPAFAATIPATAVRRGSVAERPVPGNRACSTRSPGTDATPRPAVRRG